MKGILIIVSIIIFIGCVQVKTWPDRNVRARCSFVNFKEPRASEPGDTLWGRILGTYISTGGYKYVRNDFPVNVKYERDSSYYNKIAYYFKYSSEKAEIHYNYHEFTILSKKQKRHFDRLDTISIFLKDTIPCRCFKLITKD